jgi:hypothetical protein
VIDLRANQDVIAKFDLCYEPKIDGMTGATSYTRTSLPTAGGVEQQPYKLLTQFTALESVALDELREDIRIARAKREEERSDDGGSGTRN